MNIHGPSMGIGCVLGLVAGAAGGWLVCSRVAGARAARDFDHRLDEEVARVKMHYSDKLKRDLAATIFTEDADDGESDRSSALGGGQTPATSVVVTTTYTTQEDTGDGEDTEEDPEADEADLRVAANIFERDGSGNGQGISVVSRDVFSEVDPSYIAQNLTYYAADQVLCDEKDEPLDDGALMRVIGGLGMLKFGGISGDNAICLIINEELELAIEIIRNEGSYADIVLGYGDPSRRKG